MTSAAPLSYGQRPPAYRLPDDTHLGAVRLQISDLDRSVSWYESVLGMYMLSKSDGVAVLAPSGQDFGLIELREKRGVNAVPRRGLLGLYHYALLLPDRPSLGRFISHLGDLGMRAGMSDHFVSEAVYIDDPDGLGIEIYCDRPRARWKQEDRQLSMTTIPLDVRDVVASANGEQWIGMPAGTVLGHVHLFVGDIDRAAAFYHDVLGFDKIVWSHPGALFMSAGGYHHHLGTNIWAAQSPPASDADARLLEWEIVVPTVRDIDEVKHSLEKGRVAFSHDGDAIVARDPWGTAVRVRPSRS